MPRAGHLIAGPEHHIRRDHFPGHELILCLRGEGWVRVAGGIHRVKRGHLVWINCHHPHEHGAVKADPWEVYWVRIEGPRLEQMCSILAAASSPVFHYFDRAAAAPLFRLIASKAVPLGRAPPREPKLGCTQQPWRGPSSRP